MRDIAIRKICHRLENLGVNISNFKGLDFFAREGDWQTSYYAKKINKIHAWEVDKRFLENLKSNLPKNSDIVIGDSFKLAAECIEKFDLVVLDNPQGIFGENNEYCEHFEALHLIIKLLKRESIVIFNVKTKPFNYSHKESWQKRRNKFYGLEDCSYLTSDFVKNFYKKYFFNLGYQTKDIFLTLRPQERGLYAATMILKKYEFN
jgi:16S rRNA G966 N2-methylase RsmD